MIIPICQYPFKGPHKSLKTIDNEAGVFAIMCEFVDRHYLLDVDCSDDVKKAIKNHERKKCWTLYKKGKIRYAVLYEKDFPNENESKIIDSIRNKYKTIPCGEKNIQR